MVIDDNKYPVVENLTYTTYTNKILDFPLNEVLDNNIVYSVGIGNYANNAANLIVDIAGSQPDNIVIPLYSSQYAQNLLLNAITTDGYSPHDNDRIYNVRMGYEVTEFPKYNNLNLYDLRLIRGFTYYSEIACIYVTYQINNNPISVGHCDLKTYQQNYSDRKILNLYVKIWAGSSRTRSLSTVYMTNYNNKNSIFFESETETVSNEIIDYTVDTIRANANTTSPALTNCYVLLGLVAYDTTYSRTQIANKRAGTIFHNSNFSKLNWNNMINLSNNNKPCFIPDFTLTANDCYSLCATLGMLFTPSENIAKNLDLTDDNNIINNDLYFPVYDNNKMWAGAYVHGSQNKNTDQYKNNWNADKNAPFTNGSPNVSPDLPLLGDDKLSSAGGSTSAFTKRYLIDKSTMQSVSTYINNIDDNLFTAIIDNMKMTGASPINSIVSVEYVPIDISTYAPTTENIIIGTNYINVGTVENPIALQGRKLARDNVVLNLGSCKITNENKNFLAYEPYTKYIAYIPFCNFVELEASIVLNKELTFQLILDLVAGSCEGVVRVAGKIYKTVSGTFSTQCSVQGVDSANYINGVVSSLGKNVGGIGTMISAAAGAATGGLSAAIASAGILAGAGATASSIYDFSTNSKNFTATGKSIGLIGQTMPGHVCIYKYFCEDISDNEYGKYVGYACEFSETLNNLHGFTVCANAYVECNATNTEKEKIKTLLETGVYI